MKEWTDLDYAQAAIDMLPGSVKEIVEFLAAQGITSKWKNDRCPIDRWASKWVDGRTAMGIHVLTVYPPGVAMFAELKLSVPGAVSSYVKYVDRKGT